MPTPCPTSDADSPRATPTLPAPTPVSHVAPPAPSTPAPSQQDSADVPQVEPSTPTPAPAPAAQPLAMPAVVPDLGTGADLQLAMPSIPLPLPSSDALPSATPAKTLRSDSDAEARRAQPSTPTSAPAPDVAPPPTSARSPDKNSHADSSQAQPSSPEPEADRGSLEALAGTEWVVDHIMVSGHSDLASGGGRHAKNATPRYVFSFPFSVEDGGVVFAVAPVGVEVPREARLRLSQPLRELPVHCIGVPGVMAALLQPSVIGRWHVSGALEYLFDMHVALVRESPNLRFQQFPKATASSRAFVDAAATAGGEPFAAAASAASLFRRPAKRQRSESEKNAAETLRNLWLHAQQERGGSAGAGSLLEGGAACCTCDLYKTGPVYLFKSANDQLVWFTGFGGGNSLAVTFAPAQLD